LVACSSNQPSDEELTERIHGVWIPNLIVSPVKNFTPEKDSSLFYKNNRRIQLTFNSKGTFSSTINNNELLPYYITGGILCSVYSQDETVINHTIYQEIEFLNHKKMVLNYDGMKLYYEKFVY
jgi:hypothetical protein